MEQQGATATEVPASVDAADAPKGASEQHNDAVSSVLLGITSGDASVSSSNGGANEPTIIDDLNYQKRIEMCEFVVHCATSLMLDQVVNMGGDDASAYAFSQYDSRLIAGASLFISTKVSFLSRQNGSSCMSCEVPRTLRSIANVVHAVANDTDEPMGTGSRYSNLKMCLINAEQTVLRVLGFDVDVALPFSYLFNFAHQNQFAASTTHCALKLASDVYFDAGALDLPPFVVAAASLQIASMLVEEVCAACLLFSTVVPNSPSLPKNKTRLTPFVDAWYAPNQVAHEAKWWYLYDTSDEDIADVAGILLRVYQFMDKMRASHCRPALRAQVDDTSKTSNGSEIE